MVLNLKWGFFSSYHFGKSISLQGLHINRGFESKPIFSFCLISEPYYTVSKKYLWMNEDIPWSWCCTVKSLSNEQKGCGTLSFSHWASTLLVHWVKIQSLNKHFTLQYRDEWNILIHSMIFWQCSPSSSFSVDVVSEVANEETDKISEIDCEGLLVIG